MADPKNPPRNPINEPKERFVKTRAVADVLFKGIGGFMRGLGVDASHISVSPHQISAESPKTPQVSNKGNLGEASGVEEFQIPANPQLEDAIRQATSSRFDPDQHPDEAIQILNQGFVALTDHVKMGFDRVAIKFDEHAQNVTNQFHHMLHEYEDLQDRLKVLEVQSTLGDKKTLQDDIDKAELRKKLADLEDQIRNMSGSSGGGISPLALAGAGLGLAGFASSLLNGATVASIAALMWLKKQNPYHFRTGSDQKITDDQWLKMTPEQRKKAWEEFQNKDTALDLKKRGWSDEEIQAFEKKSPYNKMISSMWDVVTGNDVHDENFKKKNEQKEEQEKKYGTMFSLPEDMRKRFGYWDLLTKSPKQLREIMDNEKIPDAVPITPKTKTIEPQISIQKPNIPLPIEKPVIQPLSGEKDSGSLEDWSKGFNAVPVTEPPPPEKKKKPWYQYLNPFYKGSLEQQEEDAIPQHAKPVMYSPVKILDLENAQSKPPTAENALPDSILTSQPDIDIEKRNINLTSQESIELKATNNISLEGRFLKITADELDLDVKTLSFTGMTFDAIRQTQRPSGEPETSPSLLEKLKGYFGFGSSNAPLPQFDESGKRPISPLERMGEPSTGGYTGPGTGGGGIGPTGEQSPEGKLPGINLDKSGGGRVDPRLQRIVSEGSRMFMEKHPEYGIRTISGYRAGGYELHSGRKMGLEPGVGGAVDIQIYDKKTGKSLPNKGKIPPEIAKLYMEYQNYNKVAQEALYPNLNVRSGGFFRGGVAFDWMHTDWGSWKDPTGQAGFGNYNTGLNAQGASILGLPPGTGRMSPEERLEIRREQQSRGHLIQGTDYTPSQPRQQSEKLSDINPNQLAFVRGIGATESSFNRREAYSDRMNQSYNNKNVAAYGQRGADYGFYQTNAMDVDDAIRLGVDPEIAKHLNGGGRGGTSTYEQQTLAMHEYLSRKYPAEYAALKSGDPRAFEIARRKMAPQWFGLRDRPQVAYAEFSRASYQQIQQPTAVRNERIDSAFGALEQKPSPFAKLFTSPNERVASVFDAMQQPSPSQPATSLKPEEQAILQENVKGDWKKLEPTPEQKAETEDVWKRTDQQRNADGSFPMQGKQVTNPVPFKDIDRNAQSLAERYGSISGMPTNHPEAAGPSPGSDGYGDQKSNPDGGGGICAI